MIGERHPCQPRLWLVRVFGGPMASGNLTGVVADVPAGPPADRGGIAAALGVPDTAFIATTPAGKWDVDSWSPHEPLRFCTQTLLAAELVLRAEGRLADDILFRAVTGLGEVDVVRFAGAAGEASVVVPPPRLVEAQTVIALPLADASGGVVVDSGRRRLYLRLPSVAELETVAWSIAEVVAACRTADVQGICAVAVAGHGTARLRVFTTSLGGREDVATGGAAAGLPIFLAYFGDAATDELTVEQGTGDAAGRGLLRVRTLDAAGTVAVGGVAELIAEGRLLWPTGGAPAHVPDRSAST